MKKVKVGFVGAGSIARAHLNAFGSVAECELVGVCDPHAATLEQFLELAPPSVKGFTNCEELFDAVKPDAIVVATPPSQREKALSQAVANGCSVLMEKPLAHTAESAQRMVDTVAESNGIYAVGFCHRFVPALNHFRELIESEKYGKLVFLHNTFGGHAPAQKDHWMSDREVSGGGVLMDVACHSLDIAHYLCGDIRELKGVVRNAWDGRGEDSYSLVAEAGERTLVQLTGSWVFSSSEFSVRLRFERCDIAYDYGHTYRFKEHGKDWCEVPLEAHANVRFQRQAQAFVNAINGESSQMAAFVDALLINQELDVLYGGSVKLAS